MTDDLFQPSYMVPRTMELRVLMVVWGKKKKQNLLVAVIAVVVVV